MRKIFYSKTMLGLLALLGGVALFSTVEVVSKMIDGRVPPFQIVFLRFFITGLVLLALVGRDLPRRLATLTRRDYMVFLLNGFVSIAVSLSLFHMALEVFEKAASCAVVFSANPIFVMLLARFINNERFTRVKLVAMLCGVGGVAFFAWESGAFTMQSLQALALIVTSALFFAGGICLSRRVISRYGVFILMGFTALFGSLMILPFALFSLAQTGMAGLISTWPLVMFLSLAGTTLAYGLYYYGLRHCTAFQASITFFLKPVLASLLAVLWLGESINIYMLIGIALILGGLTITVAFRAR